MRRYVLIFLFLPMFVLAQGKRPDQFVNLQLWIKADSLGKTFSNGASVDTIQSWGAVANDIFIAASDNRPIYRTNSSPSGLPGIDFDGTDDYLEDQISTASYNFLHNGTDNTIIIVFQIDNTGTVDCLMGNNLNTAASIGASVNFRNTGALQHFISKGVAGQAILNNTTSNTFSTNGLLQYIVTTYDTDSDPDSKIRVNAANQTTANAGNLPHSASNASQNLVIGATRNGSIVDPMNGRLYEVIIYNDKKTDQDILDLEAYIVDKWITSNTTVKRKYIQ